ncbi:MAG: transposase [Desulfarculus sp.]|nr:transposase [Pseudomonadota bacterium]MBV1716543.1 transposase [Desulfarculus sp.]MBU4382384.1 transposase [Pseudomonadota bacterium]MBU4566772.1 transposase [Pseudomonadota bacterium]MBU4576355.1 transposase [Pseudomonadota bacterium]
MAPFIPRQSRAIKYHHDAIESLNRSLRESVKTGGRFPNDETVTKLLYLAIGSEPRL